MAAIVPIVEGRSEVQSVPILVRRILACDGRFDLAVARPVFVQKSLMLVAGELEKRVAIAERDRPGAAGIVVLLDADDDCAVTLAEDLLARCEAATALPVSVVVAVREYEAWLLASLDELRGNRGIRDDADVPDDPESPRDAKGALSDAMMAGRRYVEVADQPALTAQLSIEAATDGSRSFRKLVSEVQRLAAAIPADT